MKWFNKPKPAMMLLTIIMVAVSILVPLASSILNAHAVSPAHRTHPSDSTPIPFTNITGYFFNNPNNSGTFDVNAQTPSVFQESFPTINFNLPHDMQNCSNKINVNEYTRPFTDVSSNQDGSCTPIPAQDNSGDKAGSGNLFNFEAVYQAGITVPASGQLTTTVLADDGFIFSIGQDNNGDQPTPYPRNIKQDPPPGNVSPFDGFPVMGAYNRKSSPKMFTLHENFTAAGTYLIELDYTECCQGGLALAVNNTFQQYNMPALWQGQNCDTLHDTGSQAAATFEGISSCYGTPIQNHNPGISENLGGTTQYEWECVELAMRYMLLTYGVPPYGADGKDVASQFNSLYPGGAYGLVYELNGTNGVAPQIGDIISFGITHNNTHGHVAIVSAVNYSSPGNGEIQIFQQNYGYWQDKNGQWHGYAMPYFPLKVTNYTITVEKGDLGTVFDWLHYAG